MGEADSVLWACLRPKSFISTKFFTKESPDSLHVSSTSHWQHFRSSSRPQEQCSLEIKFWGKGVGFEPKHLEWALCFLNFREFLGRAVSKNLLKTSQKTSWFWINSSLLFSPEPYKSKSKLQQLLQFIPSFFKIKFYQILVFIKSILYNHTRRKIYTNTQANTKVSQTSGNNP